MFIEKRSKRIHASLFVKWNKFKFRLYNKKGYLFFVLDLFDKDKFWVNPQMDYQGNHRFLNRNKTR